MTCPAAFTISDGTTTVSIPLAATTGTYQIDVLWERTRWTITGSGLADPGLYALDITADSWSVTIPGFADDGIDETWTVIPARPSQSRERRAGVQSWTLTLEQAD